MTGQIERFRTSLIIWFAVSKIKKIYTLFLCSLLQLMVDMICKLHFDVISNSVVSITEDCFYSFGIFEN